MLDAADLPDDVAALKAMLIAAQVREAAKDVARASEDEHIARNDERIEWLEKLVAAFKQAAFGRESEKALATPPCPAAPSSAKWKAVGSQSIALRNFIDSRAGRQALRHDPRLNLIRPLSMSLTSRLPGCEKLHRSFHGETPLLHPWKPRSQIRRRLPMWGHNIVYDEMTQKIPH